MGLCLGVTRRRGEAREGGCFGLSALVRWSFTAQWSEWRSGSEEIWWGVEVQTLLYDDSGMVSPVSLYGQ